MPNFQRWRYNTRVSQQCDELLVQIPKVTVISHEIKEIIIYEKSGLWNKISQDDTEKLIAEEKKKQAEEFIKSDSDVVTAEFKEYLTNIIQIFTTYSVEFVQ